MGVSGKVWAETGGAVGGTAVGGKAVGATVGVLVGMGVGDGDGVFVGVSVGISVNVGDGVAVSSKSVGSATSVTSSVFAGTLVASASLLHAIIMPVIISGMTPRNWFSRNLCETRQQITF